MPIALPRLFHHVRGTIVTGDLRREAAGLAYHSGRVAAGHLFFAIRGYRDDGAKYIADAIARGAVAIVSELPREQFELPSAIAWIQVPAIRFALAQAACEFYQHPTRELDLMGVTGTNGKTTTAFLIASILEAAGRTPALFGTIENRLRFSDSARKIAALQTTPESLDLQRWLREALDLGGRSSAMAAVMEVSSHSLAMDRVAGSRFHTAVWTNFARDHLDFHPTVDDYFMAKKKLFQPASSDTRDAGDSSGWLAPKVVVLNADDPRFNEMREGLTARIISFGMDHPADVSARNWISSAEGIKMTVKTPFGEMEIQSRLPGRHNASNLLAAIAAATSMEISPEAIHAGLAEVTVPGRLEAIQEGQPFAVLVDYAHTEEALRSVVAAAREMTKEGSLSLVFGCGGDRDRSKRPAMGQAAAAADQVILTSDNPRSEDPLQIINDVQVGLQKAGAKYVIEPDRAVAIARALREARSGDTVLIAGKGHEDYQIIGSDRLKFDDREVARAILRGD